MFGQVPINKKKKKKKKKIVKMKITNLSHQGDTVWAKIDSIPENAIKVDKQFVAASERSGSFHALFGDYDMYEVEDGFVIDAKEDCILNHSLQHELSQITLDEIKVLPKKDHFANVIPKGIHYTGIQQRFNPLSGIQEKIKD
jgi:hypothetical protein